MRSLAWSFRIEFKQWYRIGGKPFVMDHRHLTAYWNEPTFSITKSFTLSLGYSAKIAAGFFLIGGAGLFFWTRSAFKEAGTAIAGNKPATHLIQGGPFRFSRNPMYVAFALLYLSVASWSGNLWIFGALTAALWVISKIVIPREERFMKTKFGASYEAYSSRVRRWV